MVQTELIGARVKPLVKHKLRDRLWKEFSREARRVGNGCFVGAFAPGKVVCSGAFDGAKCPVAGIAELGLCCDFWPPPPLAWRILS